MGLLRTLIVLLIAAAVGAVMISLRQDWAQQISNFAAPVIERFEAVPALPDAPKDPYPDAITVKNAYDGGFNHFLGSFVALPTAPRAWRSRIARKPHLLILT
jgi:hypothetical protein